MKLIQKILFLSFLSFLYYCEAKPEKNFYGIPEEETKTILLGYLLNTGLEDTKQGTILDQANGLEWKKCSQGQVYRQSHNDCQGSTSFGSDLSPIDQYKRGAGIFNYCSIAANLCNAITVPMVLVPSREPTAISEAYLSCGTDTTAGKTGWRVPTYPELTRLSIGGKVALTQFFPDTVNDTYWTANANEQDVTGYTARAIHFGEDSFGEEKLIGKDRKLYLRCVRSTR
jgi:hypothetical protein